jgi:hypothetical protein
MNNKTQNRSATSQLFIILKAISAPLLSFNNNNKQQLQYCRVKSSAQILPQKNKHNV